MATKQVAVVTGVSSGIGQAAAARLAAAGFRVFGTVRDVRVKVPDPTAVPVARLDALVATAKPAHVAHRVEVVQA